MSGAGTSKGRGRGRLGNESLPSTSHGTQQRSGRLPLFFFNQELTF